MATVTVNLTKHTDVFGGIDVWMIPTCDVDGDLAECASVVNAVGAAWAHLEAHHDGKGDIAIPTNSLEAVAA